MKSISKYMGRTFILTAALLAGCSQAAVSQSVQKAQASQTQPQNQPKIETVQIGEAYKTDISALKNRPAILAAFQTIKADRDKNNQDMIELN